MYLCYVDEAGCPGSLPTPTSLVQPALVICGLIVPQARLAAITNTYLSAKIRFYPSLRGSHWLDGVRAEIKGSDLRRDIRRSGRNRRRAVFAFLDEVLTILESNDCRIVARIYIKCPGQPFQGKAVYTASMQALCVCLQRFLQESNDNAFVIADSRTPQLNSSVAHSVLTQKFQVGGDPYDRIVEMPTFGHSENHIPLQITDLLCSAVITPMATATYCQGHVSSVHVDPRDSLTKDRYSRRIKGLGYRYLDTGRWRGGLTVNDGILQRSCGLLFVP